MYVEQFNIRVLRTYLCRHKQNDYAIDSKIWRKAMKKLAILISMLIFALMLNCTVFAAGYSSHHEDRTAPTSYGITASTRDSSNNVVFTLLGISDGVGTGVASVEWKAIRNGSLFSSESVTSFDTNSSTFQLTITDNNIYYIYAIVKDNEGNSQKFEYIYDANFPNQVIDTNEYSHYASLFLDTHGPTFDGIKIIDLDLQNNTVYLSVEHISENEGVGLKEVKWNIQNISSETIAQFTHDYSTKPNEIISDEISLNGISSGTFMINVTAVDALNNYETYDEVVNISIPITELKVEIESGDYVYDGTEKRPAVTVKYNDTLLTEGAHYTITYENNIEPGNASVNMRGLGIFSGEDEVGSFKIKRRSVIITVNSFARKFGEPNPELVYTVQEKYPPVPGIEAVINGDLITDCTVESIPGSYDITSTNMIIVNDNHYNPIESFELLGNPMDNLDRTDFVPGKLVVVGDESSVALHDDVLLDTLPPTGVLEVGKINSSGKLTLTANYLSDGVNGSGVVYNRWNIYRKSGDDFVPAVSNEIHSAIDSNEPNNFADSRSIDTLTLTGINAGFYRIIVDIVDGVGNITTLQDERFINTLSSKLMAREADFYDYGLDKAYMLGAKRVDKARFASDVSKIVFVNTVIVPSGAVDSWDVSANQDKSIMSWIVNDGSGKYIQYFGTEFGGEEEKIIATSGENLFNYYTNMTAIEYNNIVLDTSAVESMSYMYANTPSMNAVDLSFINTSNVRNFEGMFNNASKLTTININTYNTSNAVTMKKMFEGCSNLTNIVVGNNFDTSNVEDMSCMFKDCGKLANDNVITVSSFRTTSARDLSYMFDGCALLTSINLQNFNSDNAINMSNMFSNCSELTNVSTSELETANVTNMSEMFKNCSKLSTINLGSFNTAQVTTMASMFENTAITSLDLTNNNLPNFDTSSVTDMSGLFKNCVNLTKGNVSGLEFNAVTTIKEMFAGCTSVTDIDLADLNTTSITYLDRLFTGDTALETVFLGANVNKFNGTDMLLGTTSLSAIITIADSPMAISQLVARQANTKLYVKDVDIESAFESNSNYLTVFGGVDNIRLIIGLIGDNPLTMETTSVPYTDAGATVAGFTSANSIKYTQYGLTTEATPDANVNTSLAGVYHKDYTLKYKSTSIGEASRTINVIARQLPDIPYIEISGPSSYEYDGKEKRPGVRIRDVSPNAPRELLLEGTNNDYTLEYVDNKDVGTATIQITGHNNYFGIRTIHFDITKRDLNVEIGPITSYTKPYGEVDPVFNYRYSNNVLTSLPEIVRDEVPKFTGAIGRDLGESFGTYRLNQGTLQVESSETFNINNYNVVFDDKNATLTINAVMPSDITLSSYDYEYDGTPKTPTITVVLNGTLLQQGADKDYVVDYRNNVNVGTATAVAIFRGNYSGEATKDFTINPRPITIVPDSGQSKTYGETDPSLTWKTVYSTTTDTGIVAGETPTVQGALTRVEGELPGLYDIQRGNLELENSSTFLKSNYRIDFRSSVKFEILSKSIAGSTVTLSPNTFVYDGDEKRPTATVVCGGATLTEGTDFYVTYKNNVNVGTRDVSPDTMPTAIIHGRGGYTGEVEKEFTITPASIPVIARIDGNLDVGSTLHVVIESMIPESAHLSYKWYTVNTPNTTTGGTQVAGATSDSLVIQESMVGKYIYAVVTASLPTNYKDSSWAGAVGPVRETTPPTVPVLTARLNNASGAVYNDGTWTNQNVWLNVKSTDEGGIDYYEYSNIAENAGYMRMPALAADNSSSITISTNQNKIRYYFRAVDKSGNKGAVVSIVVAIDKDAPVVSNVIISPNTWTNSDITVIGSARDDLSGIVGYSFGPNTNGTYTTIRNTLNTTQEMVYDHNVQNYVFAIKDAAGNIGSKQFSVSQIDEQPPVLTVVEKVDARDDVVILDIKAKDPDIDLNGDGVTDGNGAGIKAVSVNNQTITTTTNSSLQETALHSVYNEGAYVVKAKDAADNEASVTRNVYAVNYTSGVGSGRVSKQVKYENTSVTIKANGFTASGYRFRNWNTKPDGSGTTYNPGDTYSGTETITLYAQWDEIIPLLDRVVLNKYEFPYTGTAIIPQEYVYNNSNVQITKDLDYTVSYLNNVDAGEATVVVTGINKYAGQEKQVKFKILKQDPSMTNKELRVELEKTLYVYDGYAKTPKETVYYGNEIIRRGPDYKVQYLNNINAGTATIVITPEPHIDAVETRLNFTIAKADRKLFTYDVNIEKRQTLLLNYSFNGDNANVTFRSTDSNIATASLNNGVYRVTGVNVGVTTLTLEVAASLNYNSANSVVQVKVEEVGETTGVEPTPSPINTEVRPEGTIIINDGADFTVTPRTVLYISAQNANYMYISESTTKPNADNQAWQDYTMRLPYVFDSTPGVKTIYAYFKDSQGRISDVAYDTIRLVDRTSTDIEMNGNGYDEPAHDSILLDKTQINRTPPTVTYSAFRNGGLDIDVTFKQQDTLVNGTRSGVDNSTIKYGYLNLDDGSINYTWQDSNRIVNLKYATNYAIVTQAYDKAGNGVTVSNPYKFMTTDRFGTVITLENTDAQYDGAIHEIKKATFDLIDNKEVTGTITYTYYVDRECTIETTPLNSGSLEVGSAPKKPGTYYVIVRLRDDPNYFDVDSNIGELRIGWYIGKEEKNIFSYIEETATGTGEYILHVIGTEEMKDLSDIRAQDPEVKYTYWADYRTVITVLDLGTHSNDDIRNVGADVFSNLIGIKEIIIPDTITRIGNSAFDGDKAVTNKIVIPSGVIDIGKNPFAGVNTREFEVRYGNDFYDTMDGVLTDIGLETIISYPAGRLETEYRVPDGIVSIAENSFKDSDIIEHVIIPDGVQHIEAKAFADCDKLSIVEIEDYLLPDNGRIDLINVGNDAFYNIKQDSKIYTFSKDVAKLFESGTDYDPLKTKVHYPPTIVKEPEDMNGVEGKPLKFIVEVESGDPAPLYYQWFRKGNGEVGAGSPATGSGDKTSVYVTNNLSRANNNKDRYYVRVYNDLYYFSKVHPKTSAQVGYVNSREALVTMINQPNYAVERGTYNTYYFERLDDAFRFSQTDDLIRVINNVTGENNARLDGTKNIKMTFDGHTIATDGTITIGSKAQIEFLGAGGIEKSGGGYVIDNNGTVKTNGTFTIANISGSGIKSNKGSYLTLDAVNMNVKTNAINASDCHVNITSDQVTINVVTDGSGRGITLTGETRFVMDNGTINVRCTSTSSTTDEVAGIYIDEGVNGRNDFNNGTIKVSCGTDGTPNTNIGSGIINAGASDIIIRGGKIDASKAKAGIETTPTNKYGDIFIRAGEVIGGKYGALNNADAAKVAIGIKDGNVTDSAPVITGEIVSIFNTNNKTTFEFYDGKLLSGTELVIYQSTGNPSLTIPIGAKNVYTESGHSAVITEDGYSVMISTEGRYTKGTLGRDRAPEIVPLEDAYVKADERTTFEVIIINPGHPNTYIYSWEVSNDGGRTWTEVTIGNGANTSRFTTPPMAPNMDGYQYRCKVTNGTITLYTNNATLHLVEENEFKEQRPIVRVIYKDGRVIKYDNEDNKYVDMQITIKSYEPLQTVKFTYGKEVVDNLLTAGNIAKTNSTGFNLINRGITQITSPINPKFIEYSYTYDVKAYRNDGITVKAVDNAGRDATETQTIDIIYDLKVDKTISELSDQNNELVVTFFANRPVRPYKSEGDEIAYAELTTVEDSNYSFRYTYKPSGSIPNTTIYFEDEFGNTAECSIDAVTRVQYKDVIFNTTGTKIQDLTIIDAYGVAQGLETETEVNANLNTQSRYGVNRTQVDMFMGRARDIGAADILMSAGSSRAFDGVIPIEKEATQTKDEAYDYVGNSYNNYVSTVAGTSHGLAKENSAYVDQIEKSDTRLYKGENLTGFVVNDVEPYMVINNSGQAVNTDNEISEATFRAVIVNN